MTAVNHDRLHRVLQLALTSPYEGEREKAVALFLVLLEKTELSLHQLDRSFAPGDGGNELRKRVGLPAQYSVTCSSREEAMLYRHLIRRFNPLETPVQLLEAATGYELRCTMTPVFKDRVDHAFSITKIDLPGQLAAAQQQALSEYQARRRVLFEAAVQTLALSPIPGDSPPST